MSEKPRVMQLTQALNYIKVHNHVVLHYGNAEKPVDLWSPNSDAVPLPLRRAVVKYSQHLHDLMKAGDHRVCAAGSLHAQYYRYAGNGAYICEKCRELEPFIERE